MASETRRIWGHPAPKPTAAEVLALREQLNRARAEFLKVDLQTAMTFVKVARQTSDDSRKKHSCQAARRVYDTVKNRAPKVTLTATQSQLVNRRLAHLKTELQALGESF